MACYVRPSPVSVKRPLKPLQGPPEPIRFYSKDDPYYEFTNFYPSAVTIDGKAWPSTEHYFQAQKFVGTPYVEKIRQFPTAREAFQLSRTPQVSRWCRQDWPTVKDDIMLKALRCKFGSNAELRKKLLGTGNRRLIEHTQNDSYWGDGGDGSGKNQLGKLLEQVRSELQCAAPPDADFRGLTLGNKRAPPAQQPLPSVVAKGDSQISCDKQAFKNTDFSEPFSVPKKFRADGSSSRDMAGSTDVQTAEAHLLPKMHSSQRCLEVTAIHAPVSSGHLAIPKIKSGGVENHSSSTVGPKTGRSVSSSSCIGQDKKTANISSSASKYSPRCSATQILPKDTSQSSKAPLSSGTAKKTATQSPSSKDKSYAAVASKGATGVKEKCAPGAPSSNHPHKAKAPLADIYGAPNMQPHPPHPPDCPTSSHIRPAPFVKIRRANDSSVS